jgi:hypothetical protein
VDGSEAVVAPEEVSELVAELLPELLSELLSELLVGTDETSAELLVGSEEACSEISVEGVLVLSAPDLSFVDCNGGSVVEEAVVNGGTELGVVLGGELGEGATVSDDAAFVCETVFAGSAALDENAISAGQSVPPPAEGPPRFGRQVRGNSALNCGFSGLSFGKTYSKGPLESTIEAPTKK